MEMTIGKRIAALRRAKGLKQDDLAQMLEVSPQAVSKWENDQTLLCVFRTGNELSCTFAEARVDQMQTNRKSAHERSSLI